MRLRHLLLAALVTLPLGAARGQEPPRATDAMLVEGKRIPLPPGGWRVLADARLEVAPRAGQAGGTVALRSIVLGWVLERRVVGLVVVRTNLAAVAGGFGLDRDCRRRDLHLARVETPAAQTLAYCGTIGHVLHGGAPDGRADPAWAAALAALGQEAVAAPPAWLQVAMRFADQDDLLDIRYLFDPLLLGVSPPPEVPAAQLSPGPLGRLSARIGGWTGGATTASEPGPWARNGWGARAVAGDPVRTWVLGQLLDWYDEALPELRQGFKGRGGTLPWPRPWQVAFRLAPAPLPPPGDTPPRAATTLGELTPESEALWKTLSWRAVGSILDLGVAYAFTGSTGAAGGIAFLGSIVNSTAYYVHELVWRDVGASGSPAETFTDLPEVAVAR